MSSSPVNTVIDGPSLPRSVRWRLQMGLLHLPLAQTNDETIRSFLYKANTQNLRLQRDRYSKLVARHKQDYIESKQELKMVKTTVSTTNSSSTQEQQDPLTAAVIQLEALEEKDQVETQTAQRRRSIHTANRRRSRCSMRRLSNQLDIDQEPFSSTERLEVIQKDVARLDTGHAQHYHSRINWQRQVEDGLEPQEFSESLKERNANLMQVLHTYTNQHGTYHQGMHEIYSYIMFVIEMDLFDQETSSQDDFTELLNNDYLLHDTYNLFEVLMVSLGKCYDESAAMSNSVVSKIPYVALDKELYNHIQTVPMSHEVYCAKWVRLMFSRELQSWRNVLCLWDVFFDLTTEDPTITSMEASQYTLPGFQDTPLELGTWELEEVLEMTAASLIWLKRKELLSHNAENAVEILVSYQSLDTVDPLIETLLSSLHRMQTNEHMAPLRLPSDTYARNVSTTEHAPKKGLKNKLMDLAQRRSMRIGQRNNNYLQHSDHSASTARALSLTIHRQSSIQQLMDNSTCVSLLITASDDDEDYYNIDDDLNSHNDMSDLHSINFENSIVFENDVSSCKKAAESPDTRGGGRSLFNLVGPGKKNTSPVPLESIELLDMRADLVFGDTADDDFSLSDDLGATVAKMNKIDGDHHKALPQLPSLSQTLATTVDDQMALCMGFSMAF